MLRSARNRRPAGSLFVGNNRRAPVGLKCCAQGQAHDGRSAADMFGTVGAGTVLLADRAHDRDRLRDSLAERGARSNIRLMPNRVRMPEFCPKLYKEQNFVERFFNKLKHFRAVAPRNDKSDDNFMASFQRASLRIWLRSYKTVT
ncbi:MAG: hypothetical protein ACC619_05190 [Paracoccaceae bacterium]